MPSWTPPSMAKGQKVQGSRGYTVWVGQSRSIWLSGGSCAGLSSHASSKTCDLPQYLRTDVTHAEPQRMQLSLWQVVMVFWGCRCAHLQSSRTGSRF